MPTSKPSRVAPLPKAALAGTLDVRQVGTAGQIAYVFTVTVVESGGVSATVSDVSINFDNGFGGQCIFTAAQLGQARVPANGQLTLSPMICDNGHDQAFNVFIQVRLTDDNGYKASVAWSRDKL